MIPRSEIDREIRASVKNNPVTALLGPRQCGKTTLARSLNFRRPVSYFDLENPLDNARLQNPMRALEDLKGIVVIDEIQRRPDLFELLRVFSDRKPLPARFLILGSASPELMRHSSETLAGRVHFVDIGGFALSEVGEHHWKKLWVRGGFPLSFLAKTEAQSQSWREDFIRTFLERDIPQLGIRIPALALRRFWTMIAHHHGQIWNGSEIGASLGIAHTTSRQYLDILTGAFLIRQLPAWFENAGKRLVKSPKIYVRDSGLLHTLLRVNDFKLLESHPKLGASWEGFVLEQIFDVTGDRDAYFWATHSGAELDLMLLSKGKKWGFEIKYADAPNLTKSMRIAQEDLKLSHLWIIYPGTKSYSLERGVDCVSMHEMREVLKGLR